MNMRYIISKKGFRLLCLLGIIGLSSCTNESEVQILGNDLIMELTAQVNQVKTRASSENSWTGDGTEQVSLNMGEKKVTYKVTDVTGTLEPINEENRLLWSVPLKPQVVTAWYPATEGNNPACIMECTGGSVRSRFPVLGFIVHYGRGFFAGQ